MSPLRFLSLIFIITVINAQIENKTRDDGVEGFPCVHKRTEGHGLCTNLDYCEFAKDLLKLKNWKRPQQCEGYIGIYPLVCCPSPRSAVACKLYYPPLQLDEACLASTIAQGEKSLSKEFPHMAALGYGKKDDIQWLCGGSLISEQFVLTAAHCIKTKNYGTVSWVRLGDLDLASTEDDRTLMSQPQDFSVLETYRHPEYKAPSHYHDIALVKLDRPARFSDYVSPACLHNELPVPNRLTITGWGQVEQLGSRSSHLLKADISYVNHTACAKRHVTVSKRRLPNGILNDIQVCAGDRGGRDTCPGDSGGPLQYQVFDSITPNFQIVGVTSFGIGCGTSNSIAVYVRVSTYLPWIEDIVWPTENFTFT